MKKKINGIRIGTIFTVLLCLLAAVFLWLYVKMEQSGDNQTISLFRALEFYLNQ